MASATTLCPWTAAEEVTAQPEYEVKAAFLVNFARFVEWPNEPGGDASDTFLVGVVGSDEFNGALDALDGKTVQERTLRVKRFTDIASVQACPIVFVSRSYTQHVPQILKALQHQHVLTVGEDDSFIDQGGIINFTIEDQRVRFEISPQAAKRAGLRISSQLMRLADIVDLAEERPGADD